MRNALGYVRVSTDEQAERGLGLEAQRQRIQAYCEMKGLRLTTIFEDPGLSGGKPLGSRSARGRLLAEARRTKPVVLVEMRCSIRCPRASVRTCCSRRASRW